VRKLIQGLSALVVVAVCRQLSAQTATSWHDSTDYLVPVTTSAETTPVKAEPQSGEPDAPRVKQDRNWYGAQLLLSDAVTLSALGTGIGLASSGDGNWSNPTARGFLWAGALGYALVPAAIHVLHRRPAIAFASATLRVALPGVGLIYGALMECPIASPDGSAHEKCEQGPLPLIGLSAGIVFASMLDAGLFAYDRPMNESKPTAQFGLAPYLSQDGKRGELRAFGTF